MTDTEINKRYHELFGQKDAFQRESALVQFRIEELQRACPHRNTKRYGDDKRAFCQCQACYKFMEATDAAKT